MKGLLSSIASGSSREQLRAGDVAYITLDYLGCLLPKFQNAISLTASEAFRAIKTFKTLPWTQFAL